MRTMLKLTGETEFSFEISTAAYQRYVSTRGSRWPEQERIGREPALQYVGIASAEITLDGVIYPGLFGSTQENIKKLRGLSLAREPFQMVSGTGQVTGYWAATEVSDTRTFLLDDGRPRKVEFSLKLRYYGSDYQGGRGNSGSLPGQLPQVLPETVPELSTQSLEELPALKEASTLDEITALATTTGTIVRQAVSAAQEVMYYVNNPLALAGLAANVLLPVEGLGGIRAVADAARTILNVGDQIFETISAVTALPYTLTGTGLQRAGDIAYTLQQNILHTRDTARLTGYGLDAVQRTLDATGRTLGRLPERQETAGLCMQASEQAGRMGGVCRKLDQNCSALLGKFRWM